MSNPIGFRRREQLFNQTMRTMLRTAEHLRATSDCVGLYVTTVCVAYAPAGTPAGVTVTRETFLTRIELTIGAEHVLWAKENLVNLAIGCLLGNFVKYIAWVDADVEFSEGWVAATLDAIDAIAAKGDGAFVQMFERAQLLAADDSVMHMVPSFGAQYAAGKSYAPRAGTNADYWHPGFAWAADAGSLRCLASVMGGAALMERTLGGADRHMAMALIGRSAETVPAGMGTDYAGMVVRWAHAAAAARIRLGVAKGVTLRHFWHGSLERRRYVERWDILQGYRFEPHSHTMHATLQAPFSLGVLTWAPVAPPGLRAAVRAYFAQRNEDDDDERGAGALEPLDIMEPRFRPIADSPFSSSLSSPPLLPLSPSFRQTDAPSPSPPSPSPLPSPSKDASTLAWVASLVGYA